MSIESASAFAAIAMELHSEQSSEQTIARITEYARDALQCDDAGIMMSMGAEGIVTKSATSERVTYSDAVQQEKREGPCFAALVTQQLFEVTDTLTETRWPVWADAVSKRGIRSGLGIPLHARERMIGALNLYSSQPDFFGPEEVAVAHIFGRHASIALSAATQQEGLTAAADARNVIGQAQGILMERHGLDPDTAFAVLRRYSQDNNVKLRLVAQRVIEDRDFLATSE